MANGGAGTGVRERAMDSLDEQEELEKLERRATKEGVEDWQTLGERGQLLKVGGREAVEESRSTRQGSYNQRTTF